MVNISVIRDEVKCDKWLENKLRKRMLGVKKNLKKRIEMQLMMINDD